MIDKTSEITQFIKKHYAPGSISSTPSELQLSSSEVLLLLFQVFPTGCIDDYDLFEILTTLGFEPQKINSTSFVWCFEENDVN